MEIVRVGLAESWRRGLRVLTKVEEILKITQLDQVFPEFPNEKAAVRSFPESSLNETM